MDGSPPTNFTLPSVLSLNIDPLNSSMASRFNPNTTIDTLIYQLFIEQWENASSYENYYAACMPSECRYEYSQQNGILYVITAILSLYGGLTVSLKFLIWNVIRLYYLMKAYLRVRHTTVQPWTISNWIYYLMIFFYNKKNNNNNKYYVYAPCYLYKKTNFYCGLSVNKPCVICYLYQICFSRIYFFQV